MNLPNNNINNSGLKSRFIYWSFLVLTQIIFFIAAHEVGYRLYRMFIGEIEFDLSWGIYVQYVLYIYIATVIIGGLACLLISKVTGFLCIIVELLILSYFCLSEVSYRPYKSFLLLIDAVIGIVLPFILLEIVARVRYR
jgi:hypothetical protein